jgi:hypothetical protein
MNVKIETYRGFEIMFNTDKSEFECAVKDQSKESKSFDAIKKWVDEYLKDNATFEPFFVIKSPNSYTVSKEILKIIGIRKDGRFISEGKNGEKEQVSEYHEKDYILQTIEHKEQYAAIVFQQLVIDKEQEKLKKLKGLVTGTTLKEIKSNYIRDKK